MRRAWFFFAAGICLLSLGLLTVGCGSSSGNAKLRLVNASPDESGLDLLVDTKTVASAVGYGTASSYVAVNTGSRQVQVIPTGTSTALITTSVSAGSGNNLTLVSLNYSFNGSNVVLTDDNSAPASGDFKIRIVNASPGMGTQDVYVVPLGTDISTVNATLTNLAFGSASAYIPLAAGNYEVYFTAPGLKFINLDSGAEAFSAGQIRTLLSLNNPVGAYEAAVLSDAK